VTIPNRLSVDQLVDLLETEILSGRLPTGAALPSERNLSTEYGVGRPLVREAIRSLASRGLVETSPGRGTYVHRGGRFGPLDSVHLARHATARQVVEARVSLESQTAGLAAERATPEQIELLTTLLERVGSTRDPVERSRLDLAFHLSVARASNNPVLEAMLASIAPLMVQLMMRSIGDGRTAERSHPLHWECLDAIRASDRVAASAAMEAHLRVADDTFGDGFDDPIQLGASNYARSLVTDYGSLDALVEAVVGATIRSSS
jgi:GntR family transcriptional regulator, transcriptional repressor for pyruvate dehydrogenase complex